MNPANASSSNPNGSNRRDDDSDDDLRERLMIANFFILDGRRRRHRRRLRMWPVGLSGADYIQQVLNNPNPTNCRWQFRVGPSVFQLLADTLLEEGRYQPTSGVTVEEALGMFMKVIGFGTTQRDLADRFCRSLQTVWSCVHKILDAVLNVGHIIIRPRHTIGVVHPHISGNPKYDPWFRGHLRKLEM
ncbi:hypothetical protein CJ030_MR5G024773 [Morella rubra]|uniref:DUF8040 domain-containing protein n=1 Tax=Morella rubra TaxID=262757 RepID=A0A6A1VMN0_9ROSI|nr:hypothetical protein CJ030_MR5G024773 [Morella rubra]